MEVTTCDVEQTVTAPGSLVNTHQTVLEMPVGGRLAEIYVRPGGGIQAGLERSGDEIRLAVADSGIGIPAEDLPRLFNRFHRGRNAAGYPGSGLGLAIVRAAQCAPRTCHPGGRVLR